jgi:hypothetical protein
MIAVTDTSPLCYLILIHRVWAAHLPPWVTVQENPSRSPAGLEKLQAGEQAAILLAESINADLLTGFAEGDPRPFHCPIMQAGCHASRMSRAKRR